MIIYTVSEIGTYEVLRQTHVRFLFDTVVEHEPLHITPVALVQQQWNTHNPRGMRHDIFTECVEHVLKSTVESGASG